MRRLDEYLKEADNERGYILASLTDEYIVDKWPMEYCNLKGKEDKILEIRIFNDDKELKIYRTDIGKEFSCSIIKSKPPERQGVPRAKFDLVFDNVTLCGVFNLFFPFGFASNLKDA